MKEEKKKKNLGVSENETETQCSKIYGIHNVPKCSSKKDVYSDTGLAQETTTTKKNKINLHLKELRKEEHARPNMTSPQRASYFTTKS